MQAKIVNLTPLRTQRIRASGWVHRLRDQKEIIFIVLRDGTGFLQCVLSGQVAQTYEALTLTLESTIEVVGTLKVVPEGQTAPGGHELVVDYWKVLGAAPGGDEAFTNRLNEVSNTLVSRRAIDFVGHRATNFIRCDLHFVVGTVDGRVGVSSRRVQ